MSFVPNPTQANASSNKVNTPAVGAAAAVATPDETEQDSVFKVRTFDVYWVEKHALMYKDGTTTVSDDKEIVHNEAVCLRFDTRSLAGFDINRCALTFSLFVFSSTCISKIDF